MNPVDSINKINNTEEVIVRKLAELRLDTPIPTPAPEEEREVDEWISKWITSVATNKKDETTYSCAFDFDKTVELSAVPKEVSHLVVGSDTLGPGCSIVFNLYYDYIETLYSNFLHQDKSPSQLNLSSKKGAQDALKRKDKEIGKYARDAMELLRSLFVRIFSETCNTGTWHIPFQSNRMDSHELKSYAINILNTAIQTFELCSKVESMNSKLAKEMVVCLSALKTTVTHDFTSLLYPLGELPQIDQQFLRISNRIEIYIRQIQQFLNGNPFFSCDLDKDLTREDKQNIWKFARFLQEDLKNRQEILKKVIKDPQPSNLMLLHCHLNEDRVHHEFMKIENKVFIVSLMKRLSESIREECLLALVHRLVQESGVEDHELQKYFESFLDNFKRLDSVIANSSVEGLIKCIENEENVAEVQELTLLFKAISGYGGDILNPILNLLQIRLRRISTCTTPNRKHLEYLLTFRDSINIIRIIKIAVKFVANHSKMLRRLPERYPALVNGSLPSHHLLYKEYIQVLDLTLQCVDAASESVEAIIGRCFHKVNDTWKDAKDREHQITIQRLAAADKARDELLLELAKEEKEKAKTSLLRQNAVPKAAVVAIQNKPRESKKVSLPAIPIESSRLPNAVHSIASIQESVDRLRKTSVNGAAGQKVREHWKKALCANLAHLLVHLSETIESKFSKDVIFGQTELCRKSIEASLEIVMCQFLPLETLPDMDHELHKLVRLLLQEQVELPDNVYNCIWNLRGIPYLLSQANSSVNYLYSTLGQQNLSPQAENLTRFLLAVHKAKPGLEESLFKKHRELVSKSLYFVQKVLQAASEPQKEVRVFAGHSDINLILDDECSEAIASRPHSEPRDLIPSIQGINPNIAVVDIADANDALRVINMALGWIATRSISPAVGYVDGLERKFKRNEALENVALYLGRLKDKLTPTRFLRPYDTVHGELSLLRRAHKELLIGALYHGQYYYDGEHIVPRENLRFENSPYYLMETLRRVSPCKEALVPLPYWTHKIHNVLSYPHPLVEGAYSTVHEVQIRELLTSLYEHSEALKKVTPGFTAIGPGGKEINQEELYARAESLIHQVEREKIFPLLAILFQNLQSAIWQKNVP